MPAERYVVVLVARGVFIPGGDLTGAEGWTAAVLAYNYSGAYVDVVRAAANEYATRSQPD